MMAEDLCLLMHTLLLPLAVWHGRDSMHATLDPSPIPDPQGQGQHPPPPPLSLLVHQTLQSRLCPPVNRRLA